MRDPIEQIGDVRWQVLVYLDLAERTQGAGYTIADVAAAMSAWRFRLGRTAPDDRRLEKEAIGVGLVAT